MAVCAMNNLGMSSVFLCSKWSLTYLLIRKDLDSPSSGLHAVMQPVVCSGIHLGSCASHPWNFGQGGTTENLDKAISFDQKIKREQHVLTPAEQTREHKMAPPISLMQLYLPLTRDLSRSKAHNLSWLAKRLRGWVRARNWVGNFCRQWDCTRIQKKQEPFK
jgi:hypothetical protein